MNMLFRAALATALWFAGHQTGYSAPAEFLQFVDSTSLGEASNCRVTGAIPSGGNFLYVASSCRGGIEAYARDRVTGKLEPALVEVLYLDGVAAIQPGGRMLASGDGKYLFVEAEVTYESTTVADVAHEWLSFTLNPTSGALQQTHALGLDERLSAAVFAENGSFIYTAGSLGVGQYAIAEDGELTLQRHIAGVDSYPDLSSAATIDYLSAQNRYRISAAGEVVIEFEPDPVTGALSVTQTIAIVEPLPAGAAISLSDDGLNLYSFEQNGERTAPVTRLLQEASGFEVQAKSADAQAQVAVDLACASDSTFNSAQSLLYILDGCDQQLHVWQRTEQGGLVARGAMDLIASGVPAGVLEETSAVVFSKWSEFIYLISDQGVAVFNISVALGLMIDGTTVSADGSQPFYLTITNLGEVDAYTVDAHMTARGFSEVNITTDSDVEPIEHESEAVSFVFPVIAPGESHTIEFLLTVDPDIETNASLTMSVTPLQVGSRVLSETIMWFFSADGQVDRGLIQPLPLETPVYFSGEKKKKRGGAVDWLVCLGLFALILSFGRRRWQR